jgi:DNA-directed RNA polymerase specialized sigma24 family protein
MDANEELVRLKVLELRHRLETQTETILELSKVGFSAARIADLLGTTTNTVNVTIQRARRKTKPKGQRN